MKKKFAALIAAGGMVLATFTPANAFDVTVGAETWNIRADGFGIDDVRNDAYDNSSLSLSIDGGSNYNLYVCRDGDLMSTTTIGSGKVVTCDELVTVVDGLNVRGFAYVYPGGLMASVTYAITNTTESTINFKWLQRHNYGEGYITTSDETDVYTYSDGTDYGTTPAAVAWGPTNQDCSASSGTDDEYDSFQVESESCSVVAGATTYLTFFHLIDDADNVSDLAADSEALFATRTSDSTLASGIPSGGEATNWGITGTLDISDVPAASAPYDPNESMTLTGAAQMGEPMTVAFKDGYYPVGDYFDIWMCPNQDVRPVDGGEFGDCVPVTFWNRSTVANYDQQTSALTMTWTLANEAVPGRVSVGGDNYLDEGGQPILIDPAEGDGGWCQYEGWYLIVNDYSGGTHSNFSDALSATGCSDSPSGGNEDDGALASTGVDAQPVGLLGLVALTGGIGVIVAMRRRAARSL